MILTISDLFVAEKKDMIDYTTVYDKGRLLHFFRFKGQFVIKCIPRGDQKGVSNKVICVIIIVPINAQSL